MISFQLTDEQVAAQSMARSFSREVLAPAARAADDASRMPRRTLDQLWELGIAQSRTETDGSGSSVLSALMLEEIAAGDAAAAIAIAGPLAYGVALVGSGSPEHARAGRDYLQGSAYRPASVAALEPSPAFDVTSLRTSAVANGGAFVLNGRKSMVPFAGSSLHGADVAAEPGELIVLARVESCTCAFVVPAGAAGVTRRRTHATLGLRGLRLGDVTLENVVLPRAALIPDPDAARRILDAARVGLSAVLTGLSRAVHSYVIPYTQERVVHGEALARKQNTAFKLADMHIEIEAMRWMHRRAAAEIDKRRPATRLARLAQVYAAEQAMWIADEGVQMLGGHGFTREHPVELWYRNARTLSVLEGLAGA